MNIAAPGDLSNGLRPGEHSHVRPHLWRNGRGAVAGLEFVGLVERFWTYAQAELADARRLVEKITALGGEPATDVAAVATSGDAQKAVAVSIDAEREVIAKLHEVIPHTGQEPRSEALEHFLEHLISRKQEQVDQLLRAAGRSE